MQQIDDLKTKGPTAKQIADEKELLLRNLETNSKTNGFLLTNMSIRYEIGEDLATLFNLADYYNKLTTEIVQDAAKTYLNTNNYVDVQLFPEKQ
jgi:zinc protease